METQNVHEKIKVLSKLMEQCDDSNPPIFEVYRIDKEIKTHAKFKVEYTFTINFAQFHFAHSFILDMPTLKFLYEKKVEKINDETLFAEVETLLKLNYNEVLPLLHSYNGEKDNYEKIVELLYSKRGRILSNKLGL